MSEFDLLSTVQPSEGWFAVLSIKDGRVRQQLVSTREEVDELAATHVASGRDVYFGVAKYETDASRHKDNVRALRALWLDIDCGEAKAVPNPKTGRPAGYVDQASALEALRDFIDTVGLPDPVLVNSGRGIHVYWPLEEDVTREEWEPVAAALQRKCLEHGLFVDPQVFEAARVLRIPGTKNFKDDPPSPVEVLRPGEPTAFADLCSLLGVDDDPAPRQLFTKDPVLRQRSELTKYVMEGSALKCSFARIIERSEVGDGCAQMLQAVTDRASLSYDLWTAALSIANKCQLDRDEGIRMVSEGHRDYNFEAASAKAATFSAPRTCAKIDLDNPGGCTGCKHKGKINTPFVLGRVVAEADPDMTIVVPGTNGFDDEEVVPFYPNPFFWAEEGGIWKQPKGAEGEPVFVYAHHLYVVKRTQDPEEGDMFVMHLHLPSHAIRTFTVSNKQATDPMELRRILAQHGVMCERKQFDLIIQYVIRSLQVLVYKGDPTKMRLQFGWTDNNTKFVIGDREIGPEGTFHTPPSTVTTALAQHMVPTGSLAKWKEVFALYGREGLEPHAFAALTAFGSPLLRFTGQRGGMINVIHPRSGTGKTTILHMCNSVWGDPEALCGKKSDTLNAKIIRMGILNSLSATFDELTNTKAEEFSELIYCIEQGRGKDRVKASTNELRHNASTWRTMALCSSNASFYQKLAAYKGVPDGESMRLLEYAIEYSDAIDPAHAKHMFDHVLKENFGHAGPIFAEYLVNNQKEVEDTVLGLQAKIDAELKLTQRERIWSAMVAANMAGGLIAKRLKLIDWDLQRVYRWVCSSIESMRGDVTPPLTDAAAIIGDFVTRNMRSILAVREHADLRSNMPPRPLKEPESGTLVLRYEPDTKKMFIIAKAFREDCAKQQIDYKATLSELSLKGMYLGSGMKRITKGMKVSSPSVYCLEFDCSHPEFIALDDQFDVDPETADASGDD